jgi:hypothetical protein
MQHTPPHPAQGGREGKREGREEMERRKEGGNKKGKKREAKKERKRDRKNKVTKAGNEDSEKENPILYKTQPITDGPPLHNF